MYCSKCGMKISSEILSRVACPDSLLKKKDEDRIRTIAHKECKKVIKAMLNIEAMDNITAKFLAFSARAGEPWTDVEENELKYELAAFIDKTAQAHQRSRGAIYSRIVRLYR